MNRTELKEALAKEGKKFDGNVTEGSLEAQMIVVEDAIARAKADGRKEYLDSLKAALADDSAEFFARLRESGIRETEAKFTCGTSIAPAGWTCSRSAGHDGPCAAWRL